MVAWWLWAVAWVAHAGFPVQELAYDVDVAGPLAEVTLEQTFVNDGDAAIEAIYVFPLHEHAAVDGVWMQIGDRVIEAVVEERQQARAQYDQALEEGRAAALTTQERPNVFTQRVANIPPGAQVRVRLRVVQPVPHPDGAYELTLPLVVAPRFVAPEDLAAVPPYAPIGDLLPRPDTGLRAHVDVRVDHGLPIRALGCPTHHLEITAPRPSARHITGVVRPTRDLVLRWSVSPERPDAALLVQDEHALLTLEAPDAPPREEIVPRELIWVVDQSNSMRGQPLHLARRAMHRVLDRLDARDSFRILRFADTVQGVSASRVATPEALAQGHETIANLQAGGTTYLLEALQEALDTPRDPSGRRRYVVLLTDGLVWADEPVVATLVDRLGDATLVTLGIGPAPNRAMLDDLARRGGGRTLWLGDDADVEEGVERLLRALDQPVLSDIEIDWGNWVVDGPSPPALPDLLAGQPLHTLVRVERRGSSPVVVRGQLPEGPYERVLRPVVIESGRHVSSSWARSRIAVLDGQMLWGDEPAIVDQIIDVSLEYQVLSPYTAFLALDRRPVRQRPLGPPEGKVQPPDTPQPRDPDPYTGPVYEYDRRRGGGVEEIVVQSTRDAVEVESTSRGAVLHKDFLERVPAGRSYQNAVQMAAGVTGAGGNPNMAGGASNENTYLVDGVNITDPVTGTFSMNFDYDALQEIELFTGAFLAEHPGTDTSVVNLVTASGTNNLEAAVGVGHGAGTPEAPLGADHADGQISGPMVRDRVWFLGSYGFDRVDTAGRSFLGHTGFAKVTVQPTTEHRFIASAAGDRAEVGLVEGPQDQGGTLGTGRWMWFLSPEYNVDTRVLVQGRALGPDRWSRTAVQSKLSLLSIDDPWGGTHDVKAGFDVDRTAWALDVPPPWAPSDGEATGTRGSGFVQDGWALRNVLFVGAGLRLDTALGRAHPGPRLFVGWDPFGDQRTKLMAGGGRYHAQLDLMARAIEPEAGLPRLDEALGVVERELIRDLAVGVEGRLRRRTGLVSLDAGRVSRDSRSLHLYARKVQTRRWFARVAWTYTSLVGPAEGTLVDVGGVEGFAHSADGSFGWDLPTDPWTLGIGLWGVVYAEPLGTLTPSFGSVGWTNTPRVSGGVSLEQQIDVRKGEVVLQLAASHLRLLADPPTVDGIRLLQAPSPELWGYEGLRLTGGLEYRF